MCILYNRRIKIILICLIEYKLVCLIKKKKIMKSMVCSALCCALCFFVLNLNTWTKSNIVSSFTFKFNKTL